MINLPYLDDFNKELKIIKQREENYILLLENFKKWKTELIITEIDY